MEKAWQATVRKADKRSMLFVLAAILISSDCVKADEPPRTPAEIVEMKAAIQAQLAKESGVAVRGISVPQGEPWVWCSRQYAAAKKNPKQLQALVAEHLLVADRRFFKSKDVKERRKGLGMVVEACLCATHTLKDKKVSTEIAEAYLLPNFSDGDDDATEYVSKDTALEAVVDAYAVAEDAPNLINAFKLLLENAPNRNKQDAVRLRLAHVLSKQGDYEEAIRFLEQIGGEGVEGARNLIPTFQQQLRERQAKETK